MMALSGLHSLRAFLRPPRCVPGLLQVRQGCLSHRRAGGMLQSSLSLVPGDGSQTRPVSLTVTFPLYPATQAKPEPAPQAKASGQANRPLSQEHWGCTLFIYPLQCPGTGSLTRTASLIAAGPWDSRTQPLWPPEQGDQEASVPWRVTTENRSPNVCRNPVQEVLSL